MIPFERSSPLHDTSRAGKVGLTARLPRKVGSILHIRGGWSGSSSEYEFFAESRKCRGMRGKEVDMEGCARFHGCRWVQTPFITHAVGGSSRCVGELVVVKGKIDALSRF